MYRYGAFTLYFLSRSFAVRDRNAGHCEKRSDCNNVDNLWQKDIQFLKGVQSLMALTAKIYTVTNGLEGRQLLMFSRTIIRKVLLLKVHKNGSFFGSDFEICTISLLVMLKY